MLNGISTNGCLAQVLGGAVTWEMTNCTLGTQQFSWSGTDADQFGYLALNVGGYGTTVGNLTKSTNTAVPVDQAITGWGYDHDAGGVEFASGVKTTESAGSTDTRFAYGAWDGAHEQAILVTDPQVATANADSRIMTDKVLAIGTADAAVLAEADGKTIDDDGVTVTWTTNNDQAYRMGYWSIG